MFENLDPMVNSQTSEVKTVVPRDESAPSGSSVDETVKDDNDTSTKSIEEPQGNREDIPNDPLYIEAESFLDDLQGRYSTFTSETLAEGVELLGKLEIQVGDLQGKTDPFMVQQSKIALAVLQGARKLKVKGKTLFGTYIKSMSKSKFYNLMLIGKHPEVHQYAYLGMERLLALLKLAKRMGVSFEDLLRDHNLIFNLGGQESLPAFKVRLDKEVAATKASRRGQNPDLQIILKLYRNMAKVEVGFSSLRQKPELVGQVDIEKVTSLKDTLAEFESSIRPN